MRNSRRIWRLKERRRRREGGERGKGNGGGGGVCEGAAACVVVVGWWQCRVTAGEDVMEADMEKVVSVVSNDCHSVV